MQVAPVHMRHAAIEGTELILDRLSRRLAKRGHQVTIVFRSHVEASHPSIRFVVLRSRVVASAWRMWAFALAVEPHVRESNYDLVLGLGLCHGITDPLRRPPPPLAALRLLGNHAGCLRRRALPATTVARRNGPVIP